MSYQLVVSEKPSVGAAYAKVLGATNRQDGYWEGNGYLVSWCIGHLVELAPPNVYDAKYVKWSIADLPILPQKWQYLVSASTKKQFGILQKLMHRPDVDSLVNSCDSGREGELIFRLVYQQAGCKKPFSRLWLSSMEENAIREGFAHLKPSTEYDALYNAALCRERADWMVGIRKSRLFWACLVLAAFFVFALALTFYHNSVNGMLPVISLVSFTEFLFSDYSLIFPLTLFLCLYFTEDFHTGTYSITLSKGTSRVHLFFGKLLASWGGVLFFLFVCFGVAYLSILMMGASRYDIKYSFSAIGVFLLFQCLCFLGYTAFLNLLSYLLRHRIIVTITAFFMLGVLYLYLTKISTALDMDYSLYKYWVVGLSHSLQINTFREDLIPICLTLVVYLFLPTAISLSLFLRLDLRDLERR